MAKKQGHVIQVAECREPHGVDHENATLKCSNRRSWARTEARSRFFGIKPDFASRTHRRAWHLGDCVAVQGDSQAMIQVGRLLVNLYAGGVSGDDQPGHLTGKEDGLLELLSRPKGNTVTKGKVLN